MSFVSIIQGQVVVMEHTESQLERNVVLYKLETVIPVLHDNLRSDDVGMQTRRKILTFHNFACEPVKVSGKHENSAVNRFIRSFLVDEDISRIFKNNHKI